MESYRKVLGKPSTKNHLMSGYGVVVRDHVQMLLVVLKDFNQIN